MDISVLLFTIIKAICGVVLPWALYQFGMYYSSNRSKIKNEKLRDLADYAFNALNIAVTDNIESVEATSKKVLLQKISEGELTKEALPSLAKEVAENVKAQLSENVLRDIQYTVEDFDSYLDTLIEKKLGRLKLDPESPVKKLN